MKRAHLLWLAFAFCLILGLAAMGWTSWTVLRLDRAEAAARRAAHAEENIRLALWRMESAIAPLLAQENARPTTDYAPPKSSASSCPQVLLHFQISPGGAVAHSRTTDEHAEEFESFLDRDLLLTVLPPPLVPDAGEQNGTQQSNTLVNRFNGFNGDNLANSPVAIEQSNKAQQAQQDYQYRSKGNFDLNRNVAQQAIKNEQRAVVPQASVMMPLWIGDRLVLARRVSLNGRLWIQGSWLDWPSIRQTLLDSVADLLPGANLVTAVAPTEADQARMLAALPVKIVPAPEPAVVASLSSNAIMLVVAWAGAIAGMLAVAILLHGVIALSERRASFVAAVTHELRTPLTTLRMYSEMLTSGMVTEEPRRQQYLSTLRGEADRLGHLVENVLAYSRLERRRRPNHLQECTVGALLDRALPRLDDRARQAGMTLHVDECDDARSTVVRADVLAVEQILFNLIDNACKHAHGATNPRIELHLDTEDGRVQIRVCDHGPGISPEASRRLFRPFSRSAHEAAGTAPGLGLGLAISRRLARAMHGDLACVAPHPNGACFIFSLPLA